MNDIYTDIGANILVSVNPEQGLELYTREIAE
jgi:myosin heavy subunit